MSPSANFLGAYNSHGRLSSISPSPHFPRDFEMLVVSPSSLLYESFFFFFEICFLIELNIIFNFCFPNVHTTHTYIHTYNYQTLNPPFLPPPLLSQGLISRFSFVVSSPDESRITELRRPSRVHSLCFLPSFILLAYAYMFLPTVVTYYSRATGLRVHVCMDGCYFNLTRL